MTLILRRLIQRKLPLIGNIAFIIFLCATLLSLFKKNAIEMPTLQSDRF